MRHISVFLTDFTEQSASWEGDCFSASEELHQNLWNTKVHYRHYKRPSPLPNMSQISLVHALQHVRKFHLNIILPSKSASSKLSISNRSLKKCVCPLLVSSAGGLLSALIRFLVFVTKYPSWCIKSQMCFYSIINHTHKLNVKVILASSFGCKVQPSSGHYTRTDVLLFFCNGLTISRFQRPEIFSSKNTSSLCVWLIIE
jgi:hypothetical protein